MPTGRAGPRAGPCLPAEQRLGWEMAAGQQGAWAPTTRGGLQGIKPLSSDLERLRVSRERSLDPPPLPFGLSVTVPSPSLGPWRAPSPEHWRLRQPEVTWCPVLTTHWPCHWSKLYGQPQGHPKPCGLLPQATFIKKETHVFSVSRVCPPRARTHGQRGSEALGEEAAWEGGQAGFGQQRGQAGLGTGGLWWVGGRSRASGGEGGGCLCQHRDRVSQSPKEGSPGAPEQGWGDSWCHGPAEGEVLPGFLLVQRPFAQTDSWV